MSGYISLTITPFERSFAVAISLSIISCSLLAAPTTSRRPFHCVRMYNSLQIVRVLVDEVVGLDLNRRGVVRAADVTPRRREGVSTIAVADVHVAIDGDIVAAAKRWYEIPIVVCGVAALLICNILLRDKVQVAVSDRPSYTPGCKRRWPSSCGQSKIRWCGRRARRRSA